MDQALVDREEEVERLHALAEADGRHLALVVGRRRIGKTFLLTHAWDGHQVLYFTASATTPEINRRALLHEARAWSGRPLRDEDHPTWRLVFRSLFELSPKEPVVIVLDEFQYLAEGDDGLREVASELNAVWEAPLHRHGGLLVVLSGSAVHTLQALEAGGAPLFGRLDWRTRLQPFDYLDAARMVPWRGRDRVLAYAALGGTPQYLAAVDPQRPLTDNIVSLMLDPAGTVRLQIDTAIEQEEGLRDTAKYRGILASVGLGRPTTGEIAASLGRAADPGLKRMLKQLVHLDYLEEERNFEAPSNQAIRYRLADPAQRFHYGLVLPNASAIASAGARRVWAERIEPQRWPTYVGFEVFEDVVRQAYVRRARQGHVPAVTEWGRWEGRDRDRARREVDLVARRLDDGLLTGSVKFRARPAGARLLLDHVHALEQLAASGEGWARQALDPDSPFLFVSAAGFKESFHEVAQSEERALILWTLDELYPE